jgi:leader peptidase (prepilin peptidase) / N-methyltransferase
MTALAAVTIMLRYGPSTTGFAVFAFTCAIIVISFIDIDYMIIPDVISLPGCLLGVVLSTLQLPPTGPILLNPPFVTDPLYALFGLMAGAGVLHIVAVGYLKFRGRDGMGFGDVKLLALVGILFGPECTIFTLMVSSILAVLVILPQIVIRRRGYGQYLPYGPYIALAAWIWVVDGVGLYELCWTGRAPEFWWISQR